MENERLEKRLFMNIHDVLANLQERERYELRTYLEKHDVMGNSTLEPVFLLAYNTAFTTNKLAGAFKDYEEKAEKRLSEQALNNERQLQEINDAMQTSVNIAIKQVSGELTDVIGKMNNQVASLSNSVVNLTDNISSYIDTSFDKIKENIELEKAENAIQIQEYLNLAKVQLENEIKELIVGIVNQKLPEQLKISVKNPINDHLKKYTENAKNVIGSLDKKVGSFDPWDKARLIRDAVVFGGVGIVLMMVAKFLFH